MKIAVVYNRESQAVINLFGIPNKEKYGMDTINKVKDALIRHGHQVRLFEGDKNIVSNLEKFMPRVITGERPGLVFNLSYGIQGKGRYMHIPGILEMLGIPYVGSSPETHAIALDKVVTKMILLQRGIPTPRFAVLETPEDTLRETLRYPLIVKPKSEAVSFGLRIVNDEAELREGVETIYREFKAPTLVEEYIDGREVNVALLGNHPVEALPPLELVFDVGEKIYTFKDKTDKTIRRVRSECPASIGDALTEKVQDLAIKTFHALGCYDSARVDFRIDKDGNPYVLEVNSMASLGQDASFVQAAKAVGLSYDQVVQRLIEEASKRYFGAEIGLANGPEDEESSALFSYLTQNRDHMEGELRQLTNFHTPTDDPVSKQAFIRKLDYRFKKFEMMKDPSHTDTKSHWLYTTKEGYQDGTLFVVSMDIPGNRGGYPIPFRKEPENLYGEGIASSRAGLVSVLRGIDALRSIGRLEKKRIGVFVYGDEGNGMRYSGAALRRASKQAKHVIVMSPGYNANHVVHQRRGLMKIKVVIEGKPMRIGAKNKNISALDFLIEKASELKTLDKETAYLDISIHDIETSKYSMLAPHKVSANVVISYLDSGRISSVEKNLRQVFQTKTMGIKTYFEKLEDRPPMVKRDNNRVFIESLGRIAVKWGVPFSSESTILPSAAGFVHHDTPVVCGMAPSSKSLYTPNESVNRNELVQKTLLISQFVMAGAE